MGGMRNLTRFLTPNPTPAEKKGPSAAALWDQFFAFAGPLWEALGPRRLTPQQRRVLGGSLFPGAAEFVASVADGMEVDPPLFAHAPRSGVDLKEDQGEALDLLFLSQGLRRLADLAYDGYLQEQQGAVRVAVQVVQQQRIEAQQPLLSPAQRLANRRRGAQLRPAQLLLARLGHRRPRKQKVR